MLFVGHCIPVAESGLEVKHFVVYHLHKSFIVHAELAKADRGIITVQSPFMKSVLLEATSGLQSDTIEGVILELNFDGNITIW